jgi:cellulose synthase/poly-beta-1,6-N-acetylglucosamine synthase-like glycosyltransferase
MNVVLTILYALFLFLQTVFAIYILVPSFSLLSYLLFNLFKVKTPYEKAPFLTDKNFSFGIIVTAHQEAQFILPIVDSILKQTYPHFHVYVVADDCDLTGIGFTDKRVVVLKPETPLHAKIKSIRYALSRFVRKHDAVVILDSDNLIHPDFLNVMNNHFRKGYRVVQAAFKPKNVDTLYARMDAVGDLYNFFLDREARMRLGISSSIWGSGVAIDYDLYNEVEYTSFLGGFDKKLQAHLVQRVRRMMFAPDAVLYDEKVASGGSLQTQRTRWIFAYFNYFGDSWAIFWNGVKRGSFNLMYFGFITLRPPLFIVLGAAFVITAANYFISSTLFAVWLLLLLSFVLSFIGIVALKGRSVTYLQALFAMPLFVLRQAAALFRVRQANKSFLKTQHTKLLFIDDLLKRKSF